MIEGGMYAAARGMIKVMEENRLEKAETLSMDTSVDLSELFYFLDEFDTQVQLLKDTIFALDMEAGENNQVTSNDFLNINTENFDYDINNNFVFGAPTSNNNNNTFDFSNDILLGQSRNFNNGIFISNDENEYSVSNTILGDILPAQNLSFMNNSREYDALNMNISTVSKNSNEDHLSSKKRVGEEMGGMEKIRKYSYDEEVKVNDFFHDDSTLPQTDDPAASAYTLPSEMNDDYSMLFSAIDTASIFENLFSSSNNTEITVDFDDLFEQFPENPNSPAITSLRNYLSIVRDIKDTAELKAEGYKDTLTQILSPMVMKAFTSYMNHFMDLFPLSTQGMLADLFAPYKEKMENTLIQDQKNEFDQ